MKNCSRNEVRFSSHGLAIVAAPVEVRKIIVLRIRPEPRRTDGRGYKQPGAGFEKRPRISCAASTDLSVTC